jgi:hypothetical protein
MSSNAMVAVCDILGYSNLVKSSSLMELKDFHLKNINNIMKSAIHHFGENIESPTPKEFFQDDLVGHTIFSDTIILFSLSDDRDGYRIVLNAVYRLISIPMFTPIYKYRVGISYGEFYQNQKENIYIGKALVEANDLEKVQQWSGAALTDTAANEFKDKFPENSMLVDYDVPVRLSSESAHRKYSVVNWTLARHSVIRENQNWMYREENGSKVHSYKNIDVEQIILNTEKFHSDTCVQCKSVRSKTKS